MKIIGHTASGYLIDASKWEVEKLSGGSVDHKRDWNGNYPHVAVGTEFNVAPVVDHMHDLNRKAKSAKDGASFLRGLADILDKGIPDWIAEPKGPEAPEEPAP